MKEERKRQRRSRYFHRKRSFEYEDVAFKYFGLVCTVLSVTVLLILIGNILYNGLSRIDWNFIMDLPSRKARNAGIYTAWVGTLWIMVLTALIAFPIGVSAGLYLEEYIKKS